MPKLLFKSPKQNLFAKIVQKNSFCLVEIKEKKKDFEAVVVGEFNIQQPKKKCHLCTSSAIYIGGSRQATWQLLNIRTFCWIISISHCASTVDFLCCRENEKQISWLLSFYFSEIDKIQFTLHVQNNFQHFLVGVPNGFAFIRIDWMNQR